MSPVDFGTMPSPKNETTTLNYAQWLPIYKKEVPYQIISAFPGDYKKTNLKFEPAPSPEVIHDIRGREAEFMADNHGFQVCFQETIIQDWTNRAVVESQYYAEMECLLKKELEDVDEVFFYDWRVNDRIYQAPKIYANNTSWSSHGGTSHSKKRVSRKLILKTTASTCYRSEMHT